MKTTNKPLVVISGASSGIGASMAQTFSDAGHPLLLLARRIEMVRALNLPNSICSQVDVTDASAFEVAIERAESEFGDVDLLVNNAGVMFLGQLDVQAAEEWRQMFDVNVIGLLNGVKAVLGKMKARKGGTILNVSSVAGRKYFPEHAAYVGTKFAVSAISENLREEVADANVRVMTICPGAVETELLTHTTDAAIKSGYDAWKQSIGGPLVAEDIARTAYFMYSQPQHVNIREVVIATTRQKG